MGLLGRIRAGLSRTTKQIVDRFDDIVRVADAPERRSRAIDVETLDALEELLISADIGVAATNRIIAAVRTRAREGKSLRDLVKQEIRDVFAAVDRPVVVAHRPQVTLMVGVNGTGKTTTVGQARQSAEERRAEAADLRGGHVSGRGGRTARDLGRPRRRGHGARARRRRSRRGRVRCDHLGQGAAGAIRFSSTPPAACTPAST